MTDELDKLDQRVAELRGWHIVKPYDPREGDWYQDNDNQPKWAVRIYHPTRNWEQAGELLEKYGLVVTPLENEWAAQQFGDSSGYWGIDKTPQIAIVKAVIALLEQNDG